MYRTIFIRFKYIGCMFLWIGYFLCNKVTIGIFDLEFNTCSRNSFTCFRISLVDC